MHAAHAYRSQQKKAKPGMRTASTAAVRNKHSQSAPKGTENQPPTAKTSRQSQPTKRNHPSTRPTSNHETTIFTTTIIYHTLSAPTSSDPHHPAQTVTTPRQAIK